MSPITRVGVLTGGLFLALGQSAIPAAHAQAYTLRTLASFTYGGQQTPVSGLTLSADGSLLYGTSEFGGGAAGNGSVYSIPVAGGAPTTLASFTGANGTNPLGGVTLSADGNTLYGTTRYGGAYRSGVIYSVPAVGGATTTLASLNNDTTGSQPFTDLTRIGGTLYGTAEFGGSNTGAGTVFSVPAAGGSITTLAAFNVTNGDNPIGSLTLSADGQTFYGAAVGGTVFSVPVGGGPITTLANLAGNVGQQPLAGLTLSADGKTLYGTTFQGDANNTGSVFSLPVTGGTPTTLVTFTGANGAFPEASLTLIGNTLYGTTLAGGAYNDGTVFSIPAAGGPLTTLVTFNGANGMNPHSALLPGPGGLLYGTTTMGGAFGNGSAFVLTPTPEPSPNAALGLGLLGIAGLALKANRRRASR